MFSLSHPFKFNSFLKTKKKREFYGYFIIMPSVITSLKYNLLLPFCCCCCKYHFVKQIIYAKLNFILFKLKNYFCEKYILLTLTSGSVSFSRKKKQIIFFSSLSVFFSILCVFLWNFYKNCSNLMQCAKRKWPFL